MRIKKRRHLGEKSWVGNQTVLIILFIYSFVHSTKASSDLSRILCAEAGDLDVSWIWTLPSGASNLVGETDLDTAGQN